MMTIRIGTREMAVKAAGIVTRRPVLECPSPANAASPVYLHRGTSRVQIGQAADWQHRTERAAEQHGAVEVIGFHREGQWETDVIGATPEQEQQIAEFVRESVRAQDAKIERERIAARDADQAIRDRNRAAVTAVQAQLTRAGIASPLARIGGVLAGADRLTPESFAAAVELGKTLGGSDWDVLTEDGSFYRVRTAHPFDFRSGGIVRLELLAR